MSDEITQEAYSELQGKLTELQGKYDTMSTDYNTANTSLTEAQNKLSGYGGITVDSYNELLKQNEAYKVDGDPEALKLDYATAKQSNTTLQAEIEALKKANGDLSGFKNNTVIGGEIAKEMQARLGDSSGQFKEVYKIWINDFNLNSDNKAVTKDGLTVSQHIENKMKEPGYKFMIPNSTGGDGRTQDGVRGKEEEPKTAQEYITKLWNGK